MSQKNNEIISNIKENQENISKEITQRIYAVKGVKNTNKINIQDLGTFNIPDGQAISDTLVNDFEIKEKFSGHIYGCNITKSFLASTSELPLIHVDIWYREGQNLMTKLYEIWLKFKVDVKKVKSYKQLVSDDIEGNYYLEIRIDEECTILDESIKVHPGNKQVLKTIEDLVKSSNMMELMETLSNKFKNEQISKYDYDFSYRIPEPTIKKEDYL